MARQRLTEFGIRAGRGGRLRDHDHIQACQVLLSLAEMFSHLAFYPVALDRAG